MARRLSSVALWAALAACATAGARPPVARIEPVVDHYYGTDVVDPYRWMETPGSPELLAWMRGQDAYTRSVLSRLPTRQALFARIHELGSAGEVVREVQRGGERVFALRRGTGANSYKLVVRDRPDGKERVLIDPDAMDARGTHYAIDWYQASPDGARVAYGISPGGSEQSVLHVLDAASGKDLGESIDRTQVAHPAWLPDGTGFFYTRLQKLAPGAGPLDHYLLPKSYLHRLGTDAEKDPPLLGKGVVPDLQLSESDVPYLWVQPGSRWAIAVIERGARPESSFYATPIGQAMKPGAQWALVGELDQGIADVVLSGDDLYLLSHRDAPRSRVLRVSLGETDAAHAEVIVPEGRGVLQQILAASDALYLIELDGGLNRLRRIPYGGKPEAIALPFEGSIRGASTAPDLPGIWLRAESWTRAPVWLRLAGSGPFADAGLVAPSRIDTSAFTSLEVSVPSTDGAQVPLSIVLRKDAPRDGRRPTLMNAYGAYGASLTPGFVPSRLAWLERGGVLAIAHVRGGGEFGEEWHQAGRLDRKQHTIDDFLACARYLIAAGFTSAEKLAGEGGSAGGITIGNALVQAPELFAAALIRVGDTNTLRVEFATDGPANAAEYGSVKTEPGFRALLAVDAFHHVRDGTRYPAVMLTSGANDPRVGVYQPAKMAARLQAASSSGKPVLLRVDFDAGHGVGSSRAQSEQQLADEFAFLLWQMGELAVKSQDVVHGEAAHRSMAYSRTGGSRGGPAR